MPMPEFFTSEWFVADVDNWHLKPGAPQEIVDEFNEYMKLDADAAKEGIIID